MLPFLNNLFYIPDFLLPNMCIDIPDVRFLIFYNAVYISDMYNGYTCECLLSSIITIYIHILTNFYSVNIQCTMLYHRTLQYLCVNMFTLFSLFSIFPRPHTSSTCIIFLLMPIYIHGIT